MKSLKHYALKSLSKQGITYENDVVEVLSNMIDSTNFYGDSASQFVLVNNKIYHREIFIVDNTENEYENDILVRSAEYEGSGEHRRKISEWKYQFNGEFEYGIEQTWHENGRLKNGFWYKGISYHRLDGPAYEVWYPSGNKQYEGWYNDGKRHKLDGPARQYWYDNGQKQYEEWYINDKIHRSDGPSFQDWYENGQKHYEYWHNEGQYHKLDGPAKQQWYENGQIKYEVWYKNGIKHRLDGSAERHWDQNGQLQKEIWYKNGNNLRSWYGNTKEEWEEEIS